MFSEFQNDAHTVFGTPDCGAGARAWCTASQNPYRVLCTKPSESYQGFGTPDMAQGVGIRRRVCERERASATESERAGTVWESEDGRSVDESVRGEE